MPLQHTSFRSARSFLSAGVLAVCCSLGLAVGCDAQPASAPTAPSAPTPAPTTPAVAPSAAPGPAPTSAQSAKQPASMLKHTLTDIDGKSVDLAAAYGGKVVMIVNVASACGYTRQYAGLQALYAAKKDAGLVIIGVPSNDFGGQEPGTDAQIKEFCESKFAVTFPMMSKVSVKGDKADPLFAAFAADTKGMVPKWNFSKFLIARDGTLHSSYGSGTDPADAKLVSAVDALLAIPVPAAKPAAAPAPAPPAAPKK